LRGDEDKGSPSPRWSQLPCSRSFQAPTGGVAKGWGEAGKSKDQRKPFGWAITRILFPSENEILQQRRVSNYADKEQEMENILSRCSEAISKE
jgi:hypothetical protein